LAAAFFCPAAAPFGASPAAPLPFPAAVTLAGPLIYLRIDDARPSMADAG